MEQKRYAVKTSLLQELRLSVKEDKKNVLQRGIFQQQWVLLSQEYYEQEKEE
jgi:PHD/YefM family antitoxin component YafN of YafNO toxin-antitoxin module